MNFKPLHLAIAKTADPELRRLISAYNKLEDEGSKRVLVRTAEMFASKAQADRAKTSLVPEVAHA